MFDFALPCRRTTAWLAIVAMLVATIAPTLSHAFSLRVPVAAEAPWREICSATPAGSPRPPSPGMPVVRHCPCCVLHDDVEAVLPAGTAVGDGPAWTGLRHADLAESNHDTMVAPDFLARAPPRML